MSRSILKSSDSKRQIPIPASEGNTDPDYDTLNKVKPWSAVDDEPLVMRDVHHDAHSIHGDLEKIHRQMMSTFPAPPPRMPFDPIIHPSPRVPLPFREASHQLMQPHAPTHRSSPGRQLALHNNPASGLDNHQLGMQMVVPPHPGGFGVGDMGFRPCDMMISPPPPMPPMPPMTMYPPPSAAAPVITEDEYGNKMMELVLDVKGFMPEDIHIHTEGPVLHVHARRLSAKHDVKEAGNVEDARVAKDCRRQYMLPDVVKADNLQCYVNRKGQLTIDGALGPDIITRTNKKKVKFVASRD